MKTSQGILKARYNPLQGTRKGDRWTFFSESRPHVVYTVEREGKAYKCGCPARGLCKHIISAVLSDARPRWQRVQVFTDLADAKRQRNRMVEFTANGKPFYVVYARRRLSLDNPDVKAVMLYGPWVRPCSELVFDWKKDRVVVSGLDLLDEARARDWEGSARGRYRPGTI